MSFNKFRNSRRYTEDPTTIAKICGWDETDQDDVQGILIYGKCFWICYGTDDEYWVEIIRSGYLTKGGCSLEVLEYALYEFAVEEGGYDNS